MAAIGDAVVEVAKKAGFKVSPDFIGHGVGRVFHASPSVMHVKNNEPGRMLVRARAGRKAKDQPNPAQPHPGQPNPSHQTEPNQTKPAPPRRRSTPPSR
jgi:hypothetical protein